MIEHILSALYNIVTKETSLLSEKSGRKEAHSFEDRASQKIYEFKEGIAIFPPRHTLDLPTFSGAKHQFDSSFSIDKTIYVIECKRRKVSTKDQVYYFNSEIIDYIIGLKQADSDQKIKGIFLSTAKIDEPSLVYCVAYAITAIDPYFPPIEEMISTTVDENIRKALHVLQEKIPKFNPLYSDLSRDYNPAIILKEYMFLLQKWREESR